MASLGLYSQPENGLALDARGADKAVGGNPLSELITPDELPRWVPGEMTLDSAPLGWAGLWLRGWRYTPLDVPIPGCTDYLIVVYQEGVTPMNRRSTGDWRRERVHPGAISLLTHSAQSHWRWSDDIDVTHLYLSPKDLTDVAAQVYERHVRDVELRDVLRADDLVLSGITEFLRRESQQGGLGGQLYVESLKTQTCLHVLRNYANVVFREQDSYGGLSRAQCRLLTEYVDENLEQNISLEDLAGVVQLSVFHFMRKFRAEFGCPPYRYVMQRRIERAKRQSARPDIPLKVVAANCGFSDQSHMTRLFRRLVGVTPAEYRKDVSG
jgi:AraC family transcriptional regulator